MSLVELMNFSKEKVAGFLPHVGFLRVNACVLVWLSLYVLTGILFLLLEIFCVIA